MGRKTSNQGGIWFKDAFSPDSTLRSIVRFEDDEVVWDKLLTIDKILGTGNPNQTGIFPRGWSQPREL